MATGQTRRSVSLDAEHFVRLVRLADAAGMSMSAFMQESIDVAGDARGIPAVPRSEALAYLRGRPRQPRRPRGPEVLANMEF